MKKIQYLLFLIFLQHSFAQKKESDSTKVEKLEEVVLSNGDRIKSKNPDSDLVVFSNEQLENSISIGGEADPIKLIQLSSGVQQGAEAQSGFIVRGGNQSMNLVYLNDIYLHGVSHIGGFFPLLNSDYIRNMSFYKGGFDAEDGGRLSSVTKINAKTNLGDDIVKGSVGALSAKVTAALNLKKLNTQVLISGRRTYLELVDYLLGKNTSVLGGGNTYYFYDYLIMVQTKIDAHNKITLTNFNTEDEYDSDEETRELNLNWGNRLLGVSWDYNSFANFKNKLTVYNSYFELKNSVSDFPFNYSFQSKFDVWALKNISDFTLSKHRLAFGVEFNQVKNTPKNVNADIVEQTDLNIRNNNDYHLFNGSLFFQDLWKLRENVQLKSGVRYNYYVNDDYRESYFEPRFSLHYEFKENNALKFSYQHLRQSLHQARINTFSLPIDYYIPANSELNFQKSHQFSSGYFFDRKKVSGGISAYYKRIWDYSEFKNGALNNLFSNDLYADVVTGTLKAYGIETSLEAQLGLIDVSLNYTYSRSQAKFKEINNGETFPVVFDRPHNFNITASYKLNDKIALNGLFVYTSGQNYTPVSDIRVINQYPVLNYAQKNSARFPSYHRLDVGVTYLLKKKENYKSSLNLTIYNVYNRKNIFYIYHEVEGTVEKQDLRIDSYYESIFPIIPSISWNFSF